MENMHTQNDFFSIEQRTATGLFQVGFGMMIQSESLNQQLFSRQVDAITPKLDFMGRHDRIPAKPLC